MKNNNDLINLHIGKIIKEIALQNRVSSQKLAAVINRYQQNANKIFCLHDIDVEDIIRISYLVEYNILEHLVKNYRSYFKYNDQLYDLNFFRIKIDVKKLLITIDNSHNNYDFLKHIHIGQIIRKVAESKGFSLQDLATKLHCTKSTISYLYKCKSLKFKTLIQISNALQYHFIAEVYLPQMNIDSSLNAFEDFIIFMNSQQIRILNANDNHILMTFLRNDAKN
jgi:transcriptional regulator with XRE-family HTH domain